MYDKYLIKIIAFLRKELVCTSTDNKDRIEDIKDSLRYLEAYLPPKERTIDRWRVVESMSEFSVLWRPVIRMGWIILIAVLVWLCLLPLIYL